MIVVDHTVDNRVALDSETSMNGTDESRRHTPARDIIDVQRTFPCYLLKPDSDIVSIINKKYIGKPDEY